jgi:putative oxidoreductase
MSRTAVIPCSRRVLLLVARLLLGGIFLTASADKIVHPEAFARAVANYRILPEVAVNPFAVVLPWVEGVCGLLLLSGQWIRSASLVVSALLAVFVAAVALSLARGLDIDCGCFGTVAGRTVGLKLIIEDSLWLLMSLLLVWRAGDETGWRSLMGGGMRSRVHSGSET